MHWSKPVGGLGWLLVIVVTVGSAVTLGIRTAGVGVEASEYLVATVATVAVVAVAVLLAALLGARGGTGTSTPYW